MNLLKSYQNQGHSANGSLSQYSHQAGLFQSVKGQRLNRRRTMLSFVTMLLDLSKSQHHHSFKASFQFPFFCHLLISLSLVTLCCLEIISIASLHSTEHFHLGPSPAAEGVSNPHFNHGCICGLALPTKHHKKKKSKQMAVRVRGKVQFRGTNFQFNVNTVVIVHLRIAFLYKSVVFSSVSVLFDDIRASL